MFSLALGLMMIWIITCYQTEVTCAPEDQKEKLEQLGTDWAEADKDPRVKNLTL